jgi:hypothetical protein
VKPYPGPDARYWDELWEQNRQAAEARRPIEAIARGGWLFVVLGEAVAHPLEVAQHLAGSTRPGVWRELVARNPKLSEIRPDGSVKAWFAGAGVLVPVAWGDPRARGPFVPRGAKRASLAQSEYRGENPGIRPGSPRVRVQREGA